MTTRFWGAKKRVLKTRFENPFSPTQKTRSRKALWQRVSPSTHETRCGNAFPLLIYPLSSVSVHTNIATMSTPTSMLSVVNPILDGLSCDTHWIVLIGMIQFNTNQFLVLDIKDNVNFELYCCVTQPSRNGSAIIEFWCKALHARGLNNDVHLFTVEETDELFGGDIDSTMLTQKSLVVLPCQLGDQNRWFVALIQKDQAKVVIVFASDLVTEGDNMLLYKLHGKLPPLQKNGNTVPWSVEKKPYGRTRWHYDRFAPHAPVCEPLIFHWILLVSQQSDKPWFAVNLLRAGLRKLSQRDPSEWLVSPSPLVSWPISNLWTRQLLDSFTQNSL